MSGWNRESLYRLLVAHRMLYARIMGVCRLCPWLRMCILLITPFVCAITLPSYAPSYIPVIHVQGPEETIPTVIASRFAPGDARRGLSPTGKETRCDYHRSLEVKSNAKRQDQAWKHTFIVSHIGRRDFFRCLLDPGCSTLHLLRPQSLGV